MVTESNHRGTEQIRIRWSRIIASPTLNSEEPSFFPADLNSVISLPLLALMHQQLEPKYRKSQSRNYALIPDCRIKYYA